MKPSVVIKSSSWHFKYNNWCHENLGTKDIREIRDTCGYWKKTIENLVFLPLAPLMFLLGTPLFKNPLSPGYSMKEDCMRGDKECFTFVDRGACFAMGLVVSLIVGIVVTMFFGIPAIFFGILFLTGEVPPEMMSYAPQCVVGFVLITFCIIGIILTSTNGLKDFWEGLKNRTCSAIAFEEEIEIDG